MHPRKPSIKAPEKPMALEDSLKKNGKTYIFRCEFVDGSEIPNNQPPFGCINSIKLCKSCYIYHIPCKTHLPYINLVNHVKPCKLYKLYKAHLPCIYIYIYITIFNLVNPRISQPSNVASRFRLLARCIIRTAPPVTRRWCLGGWIRKKSTS